MVAPLGGGLPISASPLPWLCRDHTCCPKLPQTAGRDLEAALCHTLSLTPGCPHQSARGETGGACYDLWGQHRGSGFLVEWLAWWRGGKECCVPTLCPTLYVATVRARFVLSYTQHTHTHTYYPCKIYSLRRIEILLCIFKEALSKSLAISKG